jgi:hypothetical protein
VAESDRARNERQRSGSGVPDRTLAPTDANVAGPGLKITATLTNRLAGTRATTQVVDDQHSGVDDHWGPSRTSVAPSGNSNETTTSSASADPVLCTAASATNHSVVPPPVDSCTARSVGRAGAGGAAPRLRARRHRASSAGPARTHTPLRTRTVLARPDAGATATLGRTRGRRTTGHVDDRAGRVGRGRIRRAADDRVSERGAAPENRLSGPRDAVLRRSEQDLLACRAAALAGEPVGAPRAVCRRGESAGQHTDHAERGGEDP